MRLDGVAWLLIRGGRILLEKCPKKRVKMGVGVWFIPGGKIEGDETVALTLHRELREEWPGVMLERALPLPIVQASPAGLEPCFLMQPFVVEVSGPIPQWSGDGVELRWIPLEEALESPVPQVRMMIAAALCR